MDPDLIIVLRAFAKIAQNFWPALVFMILGLTVALIWERADRH